MDLSGEGVGKTLRSRRIILKHICNGGLFFLHSNESWVHTAHLPHRFQYLPLCSQESTNTYTHYMQRKYQMPWALNI